MRPSRLNHVGLNDEMIIRLLAIVKIRCMSTKEAPTEPSGPIGATTRSGYTAVLNLTALFGVRLSNRVVEVERVEQVVECRAVGRHVRIVLRRLWIWKVVAAAVCERLQAPVTLDELQQRNVVAIVVKDFSAG